MSNFIYKIFNAASRQRIFDPNDRERIFPVEKPMGDDMIPVPILTKYADADVDIDIILSLPVGSSCVIYWGDGDQSAVTGTGAEVIYNHVYASAVLSYIIALTGNITSITSFKCYSQPVSGSISAFAIMTGLEYLWLYSTAASGDIVSLITLTALLDLRLYSSSVSAYTSGVLPNWDNCSFQLQDLGLSEASVSNFLIDMDAVSVASTQSIDISGTNSVPSPAGFIAITSLQGKGWTVTASYAWSANKLTDGSFEIWTSPTDLTHWIEAKIGASTVNQESVEVYDGTYSCRFDVDALNKPVNVQQDYNLVGGKAHRFRLAYKNLGAAETQRLQIEDKTTGKYLQLDGTWGDSFVILPNSLTWTLLEIEFTTVTTGLYNLLLRNFSNASSSIYWDFSWVQQREPTELVMGMLGDSKSISTYNPEWGEDLISAINTDYILIGDKCVEELPRNWADGGSWAALGALYIDGWLTEHSYSSSKNYMFFLNWGANDVNRVMDENLFKTSYLYIIDAVKAKFPGSILYLTKVWRRNYAAECNTLDGWIDDIIALRDSVIAGDDERVWFENGDDGTTYSRANDGVHYNDLGMAKKVSEIRNILGY